MTQKNNGWTAFPQHEFVHTGSGSGQWHHVGGMTLRDWFAGQALAGLVSYPGEKMVELAIRAYGAADAMLVERENP